MEPIYQPTPRPTWSPWGAVDHAKEYGAGIWSVSTPSHGGFHLSDARNAVVAEFWRSADGWYEEDCDWSIVCLTFPEFFTATWQAQADATLRNTYPQGYEALYGVKLTPETSQALAEADFWMRHIDDFVVRAAWGDQMAWVPQGFVGVCAGAGRREGCGSPREQAYFLIPEGEYERVGFGFVVDLERHERIKTPTNTHARKTRLAA